MTHYWEMKIKSNCGRGTMLLRERTMGGLSDEYFNQTGTLVSAKQLRNVYWGRSPTRANYITITKCKL